MFVSCDAAQLEWRTVVELSRDDVALEEIMKGQDTHELNRQAFNLPSRLISKIYLFRTIFRGTGYSFANDPDFMHVSSSAEYWDDINEKFYSKYSGIDRTHKEWKLLCEQGMPIVSPFGREWNIPLLNSYGKVNWTVFTNYPVQGTGADIMMLARLSFRNRLKRLGWTDVKLIQTVHDDIKVDCPDSFLGDVTKLYHEVFRDLQANIAKLFKYNWVVPLKCEVKAGYNLKDMKPVDNF